MSATVMLTGATGFVGTQIARQLIQTTDVHVLVLVRAADGDAAASRLARAWWDWPDLTAAIGTRIEPLAGDVTLPGLGLAPDDDRLRAVTHIIHTAADLRVSAGIAELRRTNVEGTANVLALASALHADHGLARLSHVSTAYVCGRRAGRVPEQELTDEYGFASAYEQSKYEGERLVQAAARELPVSIFRPGMIVGDSRTGYVRTFNTIYPPLRLYLAGKLRLIPARSDQRINVVPVDYVVDAVVRLTLDPRAAGMTFHLTTPDQSLPTVAELVDATREWAAMHLGVSLPRPWFVPLPSGALRAVAGRAPGTLATLSVLLPYFDTRGQFQRDNTDRLLGPYHPEWRTLVPALLGYAASQSFLHRSDRTVHEQALFRLQSEHRPVTYHDIVEGRVLTRPGPEVRRDMLAAARALRRMGVRAGDRVAVVGLNGTRYLTLDVAIGLVGAVSVPLYYTSPPADIDAVLAASGARLLLVGAPGLLARLGELSATIPVVSFCRQLPPAGLARPVLSWDAFLASGELGGAAVEEAPIVPDDLATLRYTSGTTGPPKGVVFTHRQLRWMAETLAGLIPWRARHAPATYLSFLPLNHVVEGILGTYGPYYLPAPVDIVFLEDIRDLPRALPQVRPTVFFSVPRVYEKVWDNLQANPLGRRYLTWPGRRGKRLLGALLRRQVLRRAGFDRAVWLIAGSAPVDEGLLRGLRELGIEVHDAYGLTEAPLVTINRLGANRLGTVGQPLPETELRVAEDGEILVRGPQVTSGYSDPDLASPLCDGWLLTGDLGHLTADGSLAIDGRKKDLLATSYGKKIQAAKVEARLRKIPGVAEAMLVGEGRPYCTALLWLDDGNREEVDRSIVTANRDLSHPEQVKRWALLPNDLSIEGGELTANLKLRRHVVERRHAALLEALYDGPAVPGEDVHIGGAPREEPVPA
ncbi:MAG TPA: SDR family oxidoreductase [Thermomicrobiaceae bacterium]|nr:SDR family oxidoreductase [Thermomicrobiaceae bacterium]